MQVPVNDAERLKLRRSLEICLSRWLTALAKNSKTLLGTSSEESNSAEHLSMHLAESSLKMMHQDLRHHPMG